MRHRTRIPARRTPRHPSHPLASVAVCALVVGLAACGGPAKETRRDTTEPTPTSPTAEQSAAQTDRMDDINRLCNRKAGIAVPTCWNEEYMRTKKKFDAQVTLQILVEPDGHASDVKVITSTSQSKELQDCMVKEARSWSYPEGKVQVPVYCSFYLRSSM